MNPVAESLAAPDADIAPQRDNSELFTKALELAPRFDSLATLSRAVNDALDIDMTAAAWRGLFIRNPEQRERIRKKLGTATHQHQRTINVAGNVTGIVFSIFMQHTNYD